MKHKAKQKKRPAAIPYDKFVKMWKTASSIGEVAKQLGVQPHSCSSLASRLRKKGVPLRRFPRRSTQPVDVKKLKKILEAR